MEQSLGYVENGEKILSNVGVIANVMWYEIKNHVLNVELDDFPVMPNHIHGIIILDHRRDRACPVPTFTDVNTAATRFQNHSKNTLSSIVGSYESAVTKQANRLGFHNGWQTCFYDHIIRDDGSLERIGYSNPKLHWLIPFLSNSYFLLLYPQTIRPMMTINIDKTVCDQLPDLILGGILVDVAVENSSDALLNLMQTELEALEPYLTPESIREMDTVKANKKAYKALGKDPNRYRPSAESLLRRVANGKGLYYINNVVDILNLISVKTGFSICGYDYQKVKGQITLGKGEAKEPYEGIGRGELNIENLPVFRDEIGAFGTPTSDSVRTMVTDQTKQFLMIIIGFGNQEKIETSLNEASQLLTKFAQGEEKERFFIRSEF